MPRDLERLVEASRTSPRSMEGDRHHHLGAGEHVGAALGQ